MATAPSWHGHLLAGLIRVKQRDVPWQVALRNTAGVVLPLVAGQLSGHMGIGLGIGAGALMVMFADQPGPYAQRMRRILLTSAAGALAGLIGFSVGDKLAPLLAITALWTFAASLLVALGPNATRVGLTSTLLLVITAASAGRDDVQPLAAAVLILLGGVLQALLAVLAWPLQRYRPERMALADAFTALARAARRPPPSHESPPASDAINNVQTMLLDEGRLHSRALESLRILAALFERMRIELVALSEYQFALQPGQQANPLKRLNHGTARVLHAIANALRNARPAGDAAARALAVYDDALAALAADAQQPGAPATLATAARHGTAFGQQMRAALRNVGFAGSKGELRADVAERQLPRALRPGQPLAVLRANLGLDSIACRHALRSAACITLALGLSRLLPVEHAYWMPMTAAIVLKPDFGATVSYGLLRVAGTLAGLLLTSLLLHYLFADAWSRIALLAVLCFGFRQLTTMHYGIGVTALSGLVVILEALGGEAPAEVMLARAVGTAGGSALALMAYALWPTWERGRVRAALAAMLESYAAYLASLRDGSVAMRRDARGEARVKRSNAQASLERLRQEPRSGEGLLATGEAIFANGSRLARAAMMLEAATGGSVQDLPSREQLEALLAAAAARTVEIAAHLRERSPPPPADMLAAAARALRTALAAQPADTHGLADIADRIEDILATLAFLSTPKSSP